MRPPRIISGTALSLSSLTLIFSDKELLPFWSIVQHNYVAFYVNVAVLYTGNFRGALCRVSKYITACFFLKGRVSVYPFIAHSLPWARWQRT